jgi:heme exporter protein C
MLAALYLVFMVVPNEREMGAVQRIMYFHVASAWMMYVGFLLVGGASAVYLKRRSPAADRLAAASAEVGFLFCSLVLVTGPIWARPIWGVWWTWDPRLTSTVMLWTVYASYLVLRAFGGEGEMVRALSAVLGIVGVAIIPFIMIAARMMKGIHPAVVGRSGGGLADPSMRAALFVSAGTFLLLGAWLIALRVRTGRLAEEVAALRRTLEARREGAA